jgi:hypothetical protein
VGIATLDFVIRARFFFSSTSSSKSDAADKLHLLVLGTAPLAARRSESAKNDQDYLYETNQVASVHPRPSSKVQASRKGRKNKSNIDRFYRKFGRIGKILHVKSCCSVLGVGFKEYKISL